MVSQVEKKRRKKKKAKKKLSAADKQQRRTQRRFKTDINTLFANTGFKQIATRNQQFQFYERSGEIDNIFVYQNIIILCEDTTLISDKIKNHLESKSSFFEHCQAKESLFVEFLFNKFPSLKKSVDSMYDITDFKIIYLYCSLNRIDTKYKQRFHNIKYLQNPEVRYFKSLSQTIRFSARFEIFKFLGLRYQDIGINSTQKNCQYQAFVLPESPSGFDPNFKIVTLYIDPSSLIKLAYVLRKDSWNDREALYQRMLIKGKIGSMREYLAEEGRVYINNVIVSLPSTVNFLDDDGNRIPPNKIVSKPHNLNISIPTEFNSIGIIDGQHRVFSYHEGDDRHEDKIAKLRIKQQLLVTGIIFPRGFDDARRIETEAKLFLEINDKQKRTKGDLKQAIETITAPYKSTALAKSVITYLANNGPLEGLLEDHYFGDGTIKTTSIVSYALKHIVAMDNPAPEFSFFRRWRIANKMGRYARKSGAFRMEYISYCGLQIAEFISAYKHEMKKKGLWSVDKNISRALTITSLNGLIFCLRGIIKNNKLGKFDSYQNAFKKLNIDYTPRGFKYKSSNWKSLGIDIYRQCFYDKRDKYPPDQI